MAHPRTTVYRIIDDRFDASAQIYATFDKVTVKMTAMVGRTGHDETPPNDGAISLVLNIAVPGINKFLI